MSITAAPFRLDDPSLVVDYDAVVGAAAVQLKCAGRQITHNGDQEFEDIETFCNPKGEAPGAVTESLELAVLQSIGVGGLWNQLKPIEGQLVKFAFLPKSQAAVGEDNPEMSGQLWIPFIPLVDAGVRKFTELNFDFKIFGSPTYITTGTPVYSSHAV